MWLVLDLGDDRTVNNLVDHAMSTVVLLLCYLQDSLRSIYDGAFYAISSDFISLITIASGAIRLPIYAFCNQRLKERVRLSTDIIFNFLSTPLQFSHVFF